MLNCLKCKQSQSIMSWHNNPILTIKLNETMLTRHHMFYSVILGIRERSSSLILFYIFHICQAICPRIFFKINSRFISVRPMLTSLLHFFNFHTYRRKTPIENRIYIRGEFRESLGMNFLSPFQPEREFKVYKSCKCSQIICSKVH